MEAVLNFITSNAEIIGTVGAIVCVILIIKQNWLNFPIGIVKDVIVLYVFLKYGLYASSFSQFVLIGLSFYGWYKWLRGGENQTELKISRISLRETVICLAVWIVGSILFANVVLKLAEIGQIAPPSFVYWDSSITVAIFIAYWLMARKKIENWLVWLLFVNLQYLILNPIKGLYFFTFLQVVYISLGLFGFRTWLNDWRKDRSERIVGITNA